MCAIVLEWHKIKQGAVDPRGRWEAERQIEHTWFAMHQHGDIGSHVCISSRMVGQTGRKRALWIPKHILQHCILINNQLIKHMLTLFRDKTPLYEHLLYFSHSLFKCSEWAICTTAGHVDTSYRTNLFHDQIEWLELFESDHEKDLFTYWFSDCFCKFYYYSMIYWQVLHVGLSLNSVDTFCHINCKRYIWNYLKVNTGSFAFICKPHTA